MKRLAPFALLLCFTACKPDTERAVQLPAASLPYEFRLAGEGAVLWRCNRKTGDASYCNLREAVWHDITRSQKSDVFDQLDLRPVGSITDEFGGIAVTNSSPPRK